MSDSQNRISKPKHAFSKIKKVSSPSHPIILVDTENPGYIRTCTFAVVYRIRSADKQRTLQYRRDVLLT
jgi:hypothetical protein